MNTNKIQINVVRPGAADTDTDANETETSIAVPNTGGENSTLEFSATSVGLAGALIAILAMFTALIILVKRNNSRKAKTGLTIAKKTTLSLLILGLISGAASFTFLEISDHQSEETLAAGQDNGVPPFDTLAISAEDININATVDKENVYVSGKSKVTVKSSTQSGYSLGVFAASSDLVKEGSEDKIAGVTGENDGHLTLAENTWGVATEKPQNQNSAVWYKMPDSLNNALLLKSTTNPTSANDTTVLHYGAYLTPELPVGSYVSSTINYIAVANIVDPDIIFKFGSENGDVFFDEAKTQTTNTVGYSWICETPDSCEWRNVLGEYKEPIVENGKKIRFWYLFPEGEEDEGFEVPYGEEIILEYLRYFFSSGVSEETIMNVDAITTNYFSITYDANGGTFSKTCTDGGSSVSRLTLIEPCVPETITTKTINYYPSGDNYFGLDYNYSYINGDLYLLGWSENPNATTPQYTEEDHLPENGLVSGTTLYAVWGEGGGGLMEK